MNGRKIFTQIQPEKHILQAGTGFQGFCKPMNSWGKIATADLQLQLGMLSISWSYLKAATKTTTIVLHHH